MSANRAFTLFWSLLNLALLCSVMGLGATLRHSSGQIARLQEQLERSESERLAGSREQERRLGRRALLIGELRDEVARLREQVREESSEPHEPSESEAGDEGGGVEGDLVLSLLTSRPRVEDIPLLSQAEYEDLKYRRMRMPRSISARPLYSGDIDSLLRNEEWNPTGRELSAEERVELSVILKDYRFYTQWSKGERVENEILPLVDLMREQGDYIEYPAEGPPPRVEGVKLSHSEPAEDPAVKRLYLFREEDYPEMYHARAVEQERALEMFVRAYEVINGLGP